VAQAATSGGERTSVGWPTKGGEAVGTGRRGGERREARWRVKDQRELVGRGRRGGGRSGSADERGVWSKEKERFGNLINVAGIFFCKLNASSCGAARLQSNGHCF
jgi:hypothetical protein